MRMKADLELAEEILDLTREIKYLHTTLESVKSMENSNGVIFVSVLGADVEIDFETVIHNIRKNIQDKHNELTHKISTQYRRGFEK